jgi:hypothetical protein
MVAHSQFCQAGDNTLESAEIAIKNIIGGSGTDEQCLRFAQSSPSFVHPLTRYVFVLSDANFERYGIDATDIRRVLVRNLSIFPSVNICPPIHNF